MAAVVVVRAPNWLGDTVMALPALRALRAAYADGSVAVVGRWARLLAGQGVADLLLDYPRGVRARLRLAARIRSMAPDLAVVLPNSLESALMARGWGAPARLGYDADGRRALLTDAPVLPAPRRHQVDEYRDLIARVADDEAEAQPRWTRVPAPALEREATALVSEACGDAGRRAVGLHLGAAFGGSKLWPASSFAGLAARLRTDGLAPVLLGTAADEPAAHAVRAGGPPSSVASLVGRDRPELLPHLLSRLACLVSGDTGVAHLASAMGVPTVTLFGPTDPALTAPRGPRARAIAGAAPCAPCYLRACPIDHPCLRGIAVDAVARAVVEVAA